MPARTTIAILCLGWFVVLSRADEPPKYKPIDAKTIAAYEKLGAKYGEFEPLIWEALGLGTERDWPRTCSRGFVSNRRRNARLKICRQSRFHSGLTFRRHY